MKQIKTHSELFEGVVIGVFLGAGVTLIIFTVLFHYKLIF